MMNYEIKHNLCKVENCNTRPSYGFPGYSPEFCIKHKLQRMVTNSKNKPKENANLHILNTNISMWNNTDRPVPSLDTIGQINTTNTITANKATIGGLQIYKNSANVPFISRWDTSDGNRSIYFANDTSIVIRGKNVCSGC